MGNVSLTIDGRKITAREGTKVLWAALDNGIYIPNLCAMPDVRQPAAACRLCFVEVEGKSQPVTACTETISEGMVINTRGAKALALARGGFELIMSSHPLDCAHCAALHACELLKIAHHLKANLRVNPYRKLLRNLPVDCSNPLFDYDPNKCVLCGRCVWVCRHRLGIGVLGFAHRGFKRRLTTFYDEPMGQSPCKRCGDCVRVCPAGSLTFKSGAAISADPCAAER